MFLTIALIGFREISFGQVTSKTRYIDSVVIAVDSMKGIEKSITEGTIRKKYKSLIKNSLKKRPKGFFADWFYADPNNSKLLKVFSESSLTHIFISYYFLQDSLIYVMIQKEKPATAITDTVQKESYYFENGVLLYSTAKQTNLAVQRNLETNARSYIAAFYKPKT